MLRLLPIFVMTGLLLGACGDPDEEPVEEKPLEFTTSEYCEDACYFANDGECDDGGERSTSSYCKFGTDCTDCGMRVIKKPIR